MQAALKIPAALLPRMVQFYCTHDAACDAALTSSPALLPPMTLHEMSGCFQACPPKAEILTGEALRLVQQQPHRLFVRSVLDCSFCGGKQCLVRELRPSFCWGRVLSASVGAVPEY
eukprot:scaffold170376_cov15-Tisochrysis_lutea.AAC.2